MSNHRWTNMDDAQPPIGKDYVAYCPDGRSNNDYHIGRDSLNAQGHRMRIVGNYFAWDMPKVEKWILCEEILPVIE